MAIPMFLGLGCAFVLAHVPHATAQVPARTTVSVTARAMVLTRRLGWLRWERVVERADAGALRLIQRRDGWCAEVEHRALGSVELGVRPVARVEAEWVVALLVARWPELAERVMEAKER
jgi:hypothetical protein